MPFGIIGRTGPGMRQVVEFGNRFTGRGTFGGEFGASHCNQWGLTFAATRPSSQIILDRLVDCGIGRFVQGSRVRSAKIRRLAACKFLCC